jgi:hypothetical protein
MNTSLDLGQLVSRRPPRPIPAKYRHVPFHLLPVGCSFRCATGVKDCLRKLAKQERRSMTAEILSALKAHLHKKGFRDDPSLRGY